MTINGDQMQGRQQAAGIVEEYFSRHPSINPIHIKALTRQILKNEEVKK